jgi:hypothetical protein
MGNTTTHATIISGEPVPGTKTTSCANPNTTINVTLKLKGEEEQDQFNMAVRNRQVVRAEHA